MHHRCPPTRLRPRARRRPGLLRARVPPGVRGARLQPERARDRRRGDARRPGVLHEPRQRPRAGARHRRGGDVRRVQPGGRRARASSSAGARPTPRRSVRPARTAPSASCAASSATSPRASTGSTSCSPARSSRCARRAVRCTPGSPSLGIPDEPLAAAWRRGDMLREYRGDSHIAAWVSAELDATEIGLLTELYWGLPLRTLQPHPGVDRRAVRRGDRAPGVAGPDRRRRVHRAGRALREDIEVHTDVQVRAADRRPRRRRRRALRPARPVGRGDPRRQGLPGVRTARPRQASRRRGRDVRWERLMIITDDHLDARRRRRSSPRRPAGIRSPRACAGARCASRRPAPAATTAPSTCSPPPAGSACRSCATTCHGDHRRRAGLDDRAHAEHGRGTRPGADRPRRRSVPAVVAARAQGAARRLGQLLRLPHEPARVAGTARRARAPRPHRRHRRPRHRAAAHPPVDRRRGADAPEPDRHAPRHR